MSEHDKPVAWMVSSPDWTNPMVQLYKPTSLKTKETMRPLYTCPQPAAQWVGLTDEEIDRVTDQQWAANNNKPVYAAHRAYARAIEAALKEKNT